MKITGFFKPYKPVEKNLIRDAETIRHITGMDIIFLRDSSGELWHEAQYRFSDGTMKVAFDERGVIMMFAEDATLLNPVNCAVAEVEKGDVPPGLNELQEWMYVEGKGMIPRVYTREEAVARADMIKTELMATASSAITPLQDAVDTGEATDADIELLQAWKKYRLSLSRTDTRDAPDIVWPSSPVLV